MNILTEFTQRAPDSPATTAQQLIWANAGALYIADRLELLPTSDSINTTAGTNNYDLITNFSDFLRINFQGGVHYYDGTNYKPLKPVTEQWIDANLPAWRNQSNDKPSAYWKKGKTLYLYPTPADTVTDGILVNYFAKPDAQTADGDDPFAFGSADSTQFEDLQRGVVLYMLTVAKQSIGEYAQSQMHKAELEKFMSEKSWATSDDEMAINEPFRPYYKGMVYNPADPNQWGIV